MNDEILQFLQDVLQVVSESRGDRQVVYPLLQANLDKLNDSLAQTLRSWGRTAISEAPSQQAPNIAATIANFSTLVHEFPQGHRASNLEIAIAGYEVVATIFTPEAFPEHWAMLHNNLGNAYCQRIEGDRAENLETAIETYCKALKVFTREAFPENWAKNNSNLAEAYLLRIYGDRNENLEQAIQFCQAALTVFTLKNFPENWATVQSILANAYFLLFDYQQAIHFYQQALEIQKNIGNLQKEAINLESLGVCYKAMGQISLASETLEHSLKIRLEINDRQGTLESLKALASLYESVGQYLQAIKYYQQILVISRQLADRLAEQTALCNIAMAYSFSGDYELEFSYYGQALCLVTYHPNPIEQAKHIIQKMIDLLPHLSSPIIQKDYFDVAQKFTTEELQGNFLVALAPHLPKTILSYAWQIAREIKDEKVRLRFIEKVNFPYPKLKLKKHSVRVNSIAFTPDSQLLISGGDNIDIQLWDTVLGIEVGSLRGHSTSILNVAVTADEQKAITISSGGSLRIWDVKNRTEIKTMFKPRLIGRFTTAAITPDGLFALTSLYDCSLKLWDLTSGKNLLTLYGHKNKVNTVMMSPDGRFAVSGSSDNTVRLWDLSKSSKESQMLVMHGHTDRVNAVVLTSDAKRVISASSDRTLSVWDLEKSVLMLKLLGHTASVNAVALTPNGKLAISGSDDCTIKVWDLERDATLATIELVTLTGHTESVTAVAVSPDGTTIASASSDGTVYLWNLYYFINSPSQVINYEKHALQGQEQIPVTRWYMNMDVTSSSNLQVGQQLPVTLSFTPTEQPNSIPLRIPTSTLELTIYIEAPGFHLEGEHTRTLNVVNSRPIDRTLTLNLIPLTSGEHAIRLLVYPGRHLAGIEPAEITHPVRVASPRALPNIPDLIDRRAIPDPQPDVMLYVTLEELPNGQHVRVYATCPRLDLDREPIEPLPLTPHDLAGIRQAAIQAAADADRASSQDVLISLQVFGATLFDQLMPPRHRLRAIYKQIFDLSAKSDRPWSVLIISDALAILPWEMLCPYGITKTGEIWYGDFLASDFIMAHWVGRQGFRLAREAPLGQIDLTHYQQHPEEIPRWLAVLGGETYVGVENEAGHMALTQPGSPYYGLHVLRYTEKHRRGQITSVGEPPSLTNSHQANSETLVGDRRLDFNLKHPAIGLSFVNSNATAISMGLAASDTQLEAGWMLPFMHAGATAVVGARWNVPSESEQLFVSTFYQLVRAGATLGWAVWNARLQVRLTFPYRSDWLSYTYFGHPQCEPYLVRPAQGFTLFESLNAPEDDLFQAGGTYQFRASYRSEAPVWHEGRLRTQQMPLDGEELSVMVVPMTGEIPQTYPLEPLAPGNNYQCIVTLTMPQEETTLLVLVRFQKGNEELHSLMLNLDVVVRV